MYYNETMINGVLHVQHSPNGNWFPLSAAQLSNRLAKTKGELDSQTVQIGGLKNTVDELRKENKELTEDLSTARINLQMESVLFIPVAVPNGRCSYIYF